MKLINIGFGNLVSAGRVVAVVSPDSAPVKRLVKEARERGMLIDAGCCHCTDVDRFPSILLDEDPARFQDLLLGRCHRIRVTTSST